MAPLNPLVVAALRKKYGGGQEEYAQPSGDPSVQDSAEKEPSEEMLQGASKQAQVENEPEASPLDLLKSLHGDTAPNMLQQIPAPTVAPLPSRSLTSTDSPAHTPPPSALPYKAPGFGSDHTDADLKNAQGDAAEQRRFIGLMRAGNTLTAGLTHTKTDPSFYDDQTKLAGQGVTDLMQRRDAELKNHDLSSKQALEDPANPQNIAFRESLLKVLPPGAAQNPAFQSITLANPGPFEKIAQFHMAAEAKKVQMSALQAGKDQLHEDKIFKIDDTSQRLALNRLGNNKELRDRLVQTQNLDNALSIVQNAKNITPEQIQELQQAVRSNMGIKGSSGVGEREGTYYKTLGWKSADIAQFLTGNPASINANAPLLQHIKELAGIERQNATRNYTNTLNALSAGLGEAHKRHPDMKNDWDNVLEQYKAKISAPPSRGPQTQPSSDDAAALEWANANPNDPRAAEIKKHNGVK